jgi:hypothetical protein
MKEFADSGVQSIAPTAENSQSPVAARRIKEMEMQDPTKSMQPFPAIRLETASRMARPKRSGHRGNTFEMSQPEVSLRRSCCGQLRHPWELCCHGKLSRPF